MRADGALTNSPAIAAAVVLIACSTIGADHVWAIRFVDCVTGPLNWTYAKPPGPFTAETLPEACRWLDVAGVWQIRVKGVAPDQVTVKTRQPDGDIDLEDWAIWERSRKPELRSDLTRPAPGRSLAAAITGPGRGCRFIEHAWRWCEQEPGGATICTDRPADRSYSCDEGIEPWRLWFDVDEDLDVDLEDVARLFRGQDR